jgi:M6 family metalloprotease-like protein
MGDETLNYTTTATEGLTVTFNTDTKAWEYATLNSAGQLAPTGIIAADKRPAELPASIQPGIRPKLSTEGATLRSNVRRMAAAPLRLHGYSKYDYNKFRGLIILVEYNDADFTRSDYYDLVNDMVNTKGYTGYMTDAAIPSHVDCTGSVYDYYYENSNGKFSPQFDIVGPVKIDYSQYYASKTTYAQTLVNAALKAADSKVDYSKYDTDGDGTVDMVFFIFAGGGSNYSGNNSSLLWPHASTVSSLSLDGVKFGRYACSVELYGVPASRQLDGIGTICHEFSHVLGLPDLYDTDSSSSGGQSTHPSSWSIMASGSYLNGSKTPSGYSLYERYALGFATPTLISETGTYTVEPLETSNSGYRINSAIDNEFFLIENRKKTRWDAYLKGEGMLVWRVDSTSSSVWENNTVNCNPSHNYLELLRANPTYSSSGSISDSAGDPFPGSGNVTSLTNTTSPSITSWSMLPTPLELTDITTNDDGTIDFTVGKAANNTYVEDFESMGVTDADATELKGRFATWNLTKGARVAVTDTVSDNHAVALVKSACLELNPFGKRINNISISLTSASTSSSTIRCYYSLDGGSSWILLNTLDGTASVSVPAGKSANTQYNLANIDNRDDIIVRFTETLGNTSLPCYIDNVTVIVDADSDASGIETIADDIFDDNSNAPTEYYDLSGHRVANPSTGFYIVRRGNKVSKLFVRK